MREYIASLNASLEEYESELQDNVKGLLEIYNKYEPALPAIKHWKFDNVNEDLLLESKGRDEDLQCMHTIYSSVSNAVPELQKILGIPNPSDYSEIRGKISEAIVSANTLLPKAAFLIVTMCYSDIFYNPAKVDDVSASLARVDALAQSFEFKKASLYPSIQKQIDVAKAPVAGAKVVTSDGIVVDKAGMINRSPRLLVLLLLSEFV